MQLGMPGLLPAIAVQSDFEDYGGDFFHNGTPHRHAKLHFIITGGTAKGTSL